MPAFPADGCRGARHQASGRHQMKRKHAPLVAFFWFFTDYRGSAARPVTGEVRPDLPRRVPSSPAAFKGKPASPVAFGEPRAPLETMACGSQVGSGEWPQGLSRE